MVIGLFNVSIATAETLQSTNYRFDESTVGAGGLIQSSSNNYRADSVLGDLAVGEAASSNFQIQAGNKTTHDPTLTVIITSPVASFGLFSATAPSTANTTFSVLNYTAYGYVVQLAGETPKYQSHAIDAMSATNTSQPGVEQFGVNLVANTLPTNFGANPNNGQFGFGEVAPNYSTPNNYRYVSGETIALAPKSSGETHYTMSYIINVAGLTPGGTYTTNQSLIVTGTY